MRDIIGDALVIVANLFLMMLIIGMCLTFSRESPDNARRREADIWPSPVPYEGEGARAGPYAWETLR